MSRKEEYEAKTEALLLPIVEEKGYEMVDVEYVKEGSNWYLRAFIDKPGGITVDDCEVVSRQFSDILDEKEISYDYCPGVSAFCGAASALKMEYTLPGISQTVILTEVLARKLKYIYIEALTETNSM